jgi:hypothetical protein
MKERQTTLHLYSFRPPAGRCAILAQCLFRIRESLMLSKSQNDCLMVNTDPIVLPQLI